MEVCSAGARARRPILVHLPSFRLALGRNRRKLRIIGNPHVLLLLALTLTSAHWRVGPPHHANAHSLTHADATWQSVLADPSQPHVSLSLTHALSHLPGSSFQPDPSSAPGKHVMDASHAQLLRRHGALRHRQLAARAGSQEGAGGAASGSGSGGGGRVGSNSDGENGGAFMALGGNADGSVAGLYWAAVELGQPAQQFELQIDTGSNLVWVNCQPCVSCPTSSAIAALSPPFDPSTSSSSSTLQCSSATCSSMQSTESRQGTGCLAADPANDHKCYYSLLYGDGSTTTGYLVQDQLQYRQLDGSSHSLPFTFGCGFDQRGNLLQAGKTVDGLMGLGLGTLSLVSQMQRSRISNGVLAVCMGGEAAGGGTLLLGTVLTSGVAYTAMVGIGVTSHYAATLNGISVGERKLDGVDSSSFGGAGDVVFDTGTTLAVMPNAVLATFTAAIQSVVQLKSVTHPGFVCFDFSSYSYDDLPRFFPNVTLHFEGADMLLPPSNYIIILRDGWGSKSACIGWMAANGGLGGGIFSITILGDLVLKDFLLIFDRDTSRIGWSPFDCSTGTISARNGDYNVSIVVGVEGQGPAKARGSLALTNTSSGSMCVWVVTSWLLWFMLTSALRHPSLLVCLF